MAEQYRGHTIETYRVENYHEHREQLPNEIFVDVDGERVMSATELENRGIDGHAWIPELRRYAKAYIDGMDERTSSFGEKDE